MLWSRILTFLVTFLGVHSSEGVIQNCINNNSPLQIIELELTPDHPIRGKQFDLTIKFNNSASEIKNGTLQASVTFDSIPFPAIQEPLCEYINCPITIGANDISKSVTWPDYISGSVSSTIKWKDTSNNEILCIQIDTKVTSNLRKKYNFTLFDTFILVDMLAFHKDPDAYNYDLDYDLMKII